MDEKEYMLLNKAKLQSLHNYRMLSNETCWRTQLLIGQRVLELISGSQYLRIMWELVSLLHFGMIHVKIKIINIVIIITFVEHPAPYVKLQRCR